jgi:glycosyltransferase involved in cell wall biosynthesis
MKPRVTIGVCVRNSAATLHEAIESIILQDYPHELMEAVFVDDGSEDETLSIINRHVPKMNMPARVYHQEWRGLGPTRNLIVKNAEGDYIIWVDGDMILPRDHVRKQVEFMELNPRVGIAKARYGSCPKENVVGLLEDMGYVAVDAKYGGKATSRVLGTGGSIYRVEAIRHVGGFDDQIIGVGEDMDAEHRIRDARWLTYMGAPAFFFERRRKTWKGVWNENFWHGYGGYRMFHKTDGVLALCSMTPLAGLLVGAWYSTVAYKLTRRKLVFLLPLQYAFKRIAWCFGFIKAQIVE